MLISKSWQCHQRSYFDNYRISSAGSRNCIELRVSFNATTRSGSQFQRQVSTFRWGVGACGGHAWDTCPPTSTRSDAPTRDTMCRRSSPGTLEMTTSRQDFKLWRVDGGVVA